MYGIWLSRYSAAAGASLCRRFQITDDIGWLQTSAHLRLPVCCDPQHYFRPTVAPVRSFEFEPHHRPVRGDQQVTSGSPFTIWRKPLVLQPHFGGKTKNTSVGQRGPGRTHRSNNKGPEAHGYWTIKMKKVQKSWRPRRRPSVDVVETADNAHLRRFKKKEARCQAFWEGNYCSPQEDAIATRTPPSRLSEEETDELTCDGLLVGGGGSESDGAVANFKRRTKNRRQRSFLSASNDDIPLLPQGSKEQTQRNPHASGRPARSISRKFPKLEIRTALAKATTAPLTTTSNQALDMRSNDELQNSPHLVEKKSLLALLISTWSDSESASAGYTLSTLLWADQYSHGAISTMRHNVSSTRCPRRRWPLVKSLRRGSGTIDLQQACTPNKPCQKLFCLMAGGISMSPHTWKLEQCCPACSMNKWSAQCSPDIKLG